MQKTYLHFLIILFFVAFILQSCNKNLDWSPEIVSALAKGSLTLNQQGNLSNSQYGYNVNALNSSSTLNVVQFSGAKSLVAFNNLSSSPAPYSLSNGEISYINFDTLSLTGTITNPYPISFTQGMKVIIRNIGQTQAILTHITTKDIGASGTGTNVYTFTQKVSASQIKGNFEVYLDNVSSPGTSGQVKVFSGNLNVSFSLGFNTIPAIELLQNVNSSFEIIDNFDIQVPNTDSLTGSFILNTSNSFPLNLKMQVSFLASDKTTVLSTAFPTPLSILAGSVSSPTKATTIIPANSILAKNSTIKYIKIRLDYSTPSSAILLSKDSKLDYNISGDIKVKISN